MMKKLIFWQKTPSIHQSSLIKNLAFSNEVLLILQEELSEFRMNMGWTYPDFGDAKVISRPSQKAINKILDDDSQRVFHIFSGFSTPMVKNALFQATRHNRNVGIYSEASRWRQTQALKIPARLCLHRYYALRYGRHINFILAIGYLAVKWFKLCGFSDKKIYPFGYFIGPGNGNFNESVINDPQKIFKFIFIGRCIRRKGIDIFLKALSQVRQYDWEANIIGNGFEFTPLKQYVRNLKISDKVHFFGALPNSEVQQMLHSMDMLVLPSRWDGWGAVVNEALMCGVPVTCSKHCGAADLIRHSDRGDVFQTGSVPDLKQKLEKWLGNGPIDRKKRQKIRNWSVNITSSDASHYLEQIIENVYSNGPRPVAPWLNSFS